MVIGSNLAIIIQRRRYLSAGGMIIPSGRALWSVSMWLLIVEGSAASARSVMLAAHPGGSETRRESMSGEKPISVDLIGVEVRQSGPLQLIRT
jgi:hypothetical protein